MKQNPFEKPKHKKERASQDLYSEALSFINKNPEMKEKYEKLKKEDPNKAREMVEETTKKIEVILEKPIEEKL